MSSPLLNLLEMRVKIGRAFSSAFSLDSDVQFALEFPLLPFNCHTVYGQIGLSFCTFRSQFFFAFLHISVSILNRKKQCIIRSQFQTNNQKCIIRSQFPTNNQKCIIRSQPELNKKNINLFPSGAVFSSNLFYKWCAQLQPPIQNRNKAARPRLLLLRTSSYLYFYYYCTEYKPRSAIVCLPA